MFKVLGALVFLGTLSFNSFAQSMGGSDGGGGRGVVCYSDSARTVISSVELLDFYEGRLLEGYTIPAQTGDFKEIYQEAIKKSASNSIHRIMKSGEKILKGFKFIKTRLNRVEDSGEIFIPQNCTIEQLVNFQGESRIFVVKEFWDLLSETSKAGLVMHELIWYMDREQGAKTSARSRRTVSRFFSTDYNFGILKIDPKIGDYYCTAQSSKGTVTVANSFVVAKVPGSEVEDSYTCELQFETLNGMIVFSEQKAIFDHCEDLNFETITEDIQSELFSTLDVVSTIDEITTHTMTLIVGLEADQGGKLVKRATLSVKNKEFPGYDDNKGMQLLCFKLTEDDISGREW